MADFAENVTAVMLVDNNKRVPSTGPGLWAPSLNKKIQTYFLINKEEKSLHHIAMVAKVLDDNKPKKSLTARSPKA